MTIIHFILSGYFLVLIKLLYFLVFIDGYDYFILLIMENIADTLQLTSTDKLVKLSLAIRLWRVFKYEEVSFGCTQKGSALSTKILKSLKSRKFFQFMNTKQISHLELPCFLHCNRLVISRI